MVTKVVAVPSIKQLITESPGFAKKRLSDYKLDLLALCQFACRYCSSNAGNYLRINRVKFAALTHEQLGEALLPSTAPELMFAWTYWKEKLLAQLDRVGPTFGTGKTLVYSMLTDGFSPHLVGSGATREALDLILQRTQFRIRILTKNAVIGTAKWCDYFREHPDRFVVGLSTGTTDDAWAKKVELFTAVPSRRLQSLRRVQDAGVPTYGMLCPVFPDMLQGDRLEKLIDDIRPELVEHLWAEPYNDRQNWMKVRDGFLPSSDTYRWMNAAFGGKDDDVQWSAYATELYVRLRNKACREGWLHKLRYLLYEDKITASDAKEFAGLEGVLLQSKPAADGKSRNPHIAALQ